MNFFRILMLNLPLLQRQEGNAIEVKSGVDEAGGVEKMKKEETVTAVVTEEGKGKSSTLYYGLKLEINANNDAEGIIEVVEEAGVTVRTRRKMVDMEARTVATVTTEQEKEEDGKGEETVAAAGMEEEEEEIAEVAGMEMEGNNMCYLYCSRHINGDVLEGVSLVRSC